MTKLKALQPFLSSLKANAETTAINANERKALAAMIAYVGHTQNVDERTIASVLSVALGVEDLQELQSRHYEEAIRFLVDLQVDMVLN